VPVAGDVAHADISRWSWRKVLVALERIVVARFTIPKRCCGRAISRAFVLMVGKLAEALQLVMDVHMLLLLLLLLLPPLQLLLFLLLLQKLLLLLQSLLLLQQLLLLSLPLLLFE
jgi:hypothetical protein